MTQARTDAQFLTAWFHDRLEEMRTSDPPSALYRQLQAVSHMDLPVVVPLLTFLLMQTGVTLPKLPPPP